MYPIPASLQSTVQQDQNDVTSCCSAGTCYNGECEGLHLSVEEREQHAEWLAPEHQQVIIAAGQSAESMFDIPECLLQNPCDLSLHFAVHSFISAMAILQKLGTSPEGHSIRVLALMWN